MPKINAYRMDGLGNDFIIVDRRENYINLSKEEIIKLPINDWSKNNCFIWLWVTNSKDKKTKEPIIKTGFEIVFLGSFT